MSAQPSCNHNRLICPAITWAEEEIKRLTAENARLRANIKELIDACEWFGRDGMKTEKQQNSWLAMAGNLRRALTEG